MNHVPYVRFFCFQRWLGRGHGLETPVLIWHFVGAVGSWPLFWETLDSFTSLGDNPSFTEAEVPVTLRQWIDLDFQSYRKL